MTKIENPKQYDLEDLDLIKYLGLFADCAAKKEAVAARAKRKSEYLNLFLTGSGIRNQKQYQMTKITNERNANISRKTGSCFEHLNFRFRICFGFRYSIFVFIRPGNSVSIDIINETEFIEHGC